MNDNELEMYSKMYSDMSQNDSFNIYEAKEICIEPNENCVQLFENRFNINKFSSFKEFVLKNKNEKKISTGFEELDSYFNGGLHTGLYCVGACSSLGKTTFIQQISNNIAENDIDVLFYCLEMGSNEMLCRDISRMTFEADISTSRESNITTSFDISYGNFRKPQLKSEVYKRLENISKNLMYVEGNFKTNVDNIRNDIEIQINKRKRKCVVVVDYLQILAKMDKRMTEKEKTDINIASLKCMSKDFDIPIIAINSFNRANYMSRISFESFKDSGNIEFCADVLFGLQLKAVNDLSNKEIDKSKDRKLIEDAKGEAKREIELVCLKNRNGKSNFVCEFEYNTKASHFKEILSDEYTRKKRTNEINYNNLQKKEQQTFGMFFKESNLEGVNE